MIRLLWFVAIAACSSAEHEKACIADEVGPLRAKWQLRANCMQDDQPWCYAACTAGDGDACFNVAIARQSAGDPSTVYDGLFERACRLGLAPGCTNYAASGWAGDLELSSRCIYDMFQRSCDANEVFGCGMVGRMAVESRRPLVPIRGAAQLVAACYRFAGPPCRFLAYYIEQGKLGPPDPAVVKLLMREACDGGDSDACGEHTTVKETFISR